MECHQDEEDRFEGLPATWKKKMDETIATARQHVGDKGLAVSDKLRKSGVYHNIEASRAILRGITDGDVATDKTASERPSCVQPPQRALIAAPKCPRGAPAGGRALRVRPALTRYLKPSPAGVFWDNFPGTARSR